MHRADSSLGATLKQIRDQTNTKIDIPRRDENTLAVPAVNGHSTSHPSTRSPSPSQDEEHEPTVQITISGSGPLAHEAQAIIQGIIAEKTSRSTQRVRDIPAHVFPFVLQRRADFMKVAEGAEVTLNRDEKAREISISGDREAVARVVESIKSCVAFYEGDVATVKISLPKRQHHLLVGPAAEDILNKAKCVVLVSSDSSEDVHVWGKVKDLGVGLQVVMEVGHNDARCTPYLTFTCASEQTPSTPLLFRSQGRTLRKYSTTLRKLVTSRASLTAIRTSPCTLLLRPGPGPSPSISAVRRRKSK